MTINQAYLDGEDNLQATTNGKPNAWRVQGDKNIEEKTLERNLYGNSRDNMNPVKEGQAMGGHSFGKNNTTFAGNDKNNPSQYAGNTNPYFDRTEPMEEHPEHNNFKSSLQQGEPDYNKAQPYAKIVDSTPKPEKVERGNGENDRPHKGGNEYQEGTADNDGEPNIPGPNELPDQQKVGEEKGGEEIDHIET